MKNNDEKLFNKFCDTHKIPKDIQASLFTVLTNINIKYEDGINNKKEVINGK